MNGFSRRWYSPPDLFGDAPLRRIRRRLMKPPDLTRAGQPPILEAATPTALAPRPGEVPTRVAPELGYEDYLKRYNIRNPEDPRHRYDYRAAFEAGITPTKWRDLPEAERLQDLEQIRKGLREPIPEEGYMWPDEFKVTPDLTYEDYKAQPPSLRFAGIQPSEMSPYEIEEYADEMAARRKAEKTQRMQELYEQSRAEGMVLPGETIDLAPTYRYTGMPRTRREVGRSIDLRMLRRGRATPEQVAGIRARRRARFTPTKEAWERRETTIEGAKIADWLTGPKGAIPPDLTRREYPEPPSFEEEVAGLEKVLPPNLRAIRARQQYAIERPEAPTLPRYETTVTRRMPGGVTLTHKPISAPEFPTELEIEQAKGRLAAEQARKAYWERPTTTLSPIMRMVDEGLLTFEEGKGLATKEKDDDLTEKDVISIMHTIERALAATYTPLNEPLEGKEYAERRNYYAQQLEVYRNRLDQIRAGKTKPNRVKVKAPDGTIGTLPSSQIAEAVKAGYQVITD